jgi:hypothetical protein
MTSAILNYFSLAPEASKKYGTCIFKRYKGLSYEFIRALGTANRTGIVNERQRISGTELHR